MRLRTLSVVCGAVMALTACTTPPITTPTTTSTVTMADIAPLITYGPAVPVPAAGPFNVPAIGIDVPANARSLTLTSAIMNLDVENKMKVPVNLRIFLSGSQDTAYDEANLLGEVSIPPQQSQRISQPVKDPSIFKAEKVWAGITFSTPGSSGQFVDIEKSDSIVVHTSATVQVKLF